MISLSNIPDKMHALVLHDIGDLVYEEVDNYKLKKDWVLVKMKYCGICSSDIERVFVNGTYHFPTIPGHEMSGEIIAVNEEDKKLLGKHVCIFPMLPCMECDACKASEYAQCSNYNYFGSRCDGGFAEYLLVPIWNLVILDESVDYKVACLCEPIAVSIHATNILDVKAGQKIAISGDGTIGLLIAYFCKYRGASVTVVGKNLNKLKLVSDLGFDVASSDELEQYKNQFDGVVEAVGNNASINQAIELSNTFGKIVLVGNPKGDVLLNKNTYWKILRKQLIVTGSWNSSYGEKVNDWKVAAQSMKNGDIPFLKLITREYLLSEHKEAFEFLMDNKTEKFKVVFKIDE